MNISELESIAAAAKWKVLGKHPMERDVRGKNVWVLMADAGGLVVKAENPQIHGVERAPLMPVETLLQGKNGKQYKGNSPWVNAANSILKERNQ